MKNLSDCTVLIVDDVESNIDILVASLSDSYDLSVATNGADALKAAQKVSPDIILLDIMMPDIDGYEVCRKLKQSPDIADIPVIFLTALDEIKNKTMGFDAGGVDYITKPFEISEIKARVKTHLSLMLAHRALEDQNDRLERIVHERTRELVQVRDATIRSLASLAECRDNDTGNHIKRTQNYVVLLAQWYKKSSGKSFDLDIDILGKSAPLHDIGKVGVPDKILMKPGSLEDDEFEVMKTHTVLGWNTIKKAEEGLTPDNFLKYAEQIAYTHHERWDGTGYPLGLKGDDIPISGRLMAVADVYDALISPRVYKPAFSHSKAVEIMIDESETHFDPLLIEGFKELQLSFKETAVSLADSKEQADIVMN